MPQLQAKQEHIALVYIEILTVPLYHLQVCETK